MYPSDQELVKKAKRGNKQAFVTLFDRYKDKIAGYLYGYMGDYTTAQDLASETFLSIYEHLGTYKDEGKFLAWAYTIAKNFARNELRKRKRDMEVSLDKPVDSEGSISLADVIADNKTRPDYQARAAELKKAVYKSLAKLDKKYKDVLLLCDVDGLSYDEAAKMLKCNPLSVGKRLERARDKLYDLLRQAGHTI